MMRILAMCVVVVVVASGCGGDPARVGTERPDPTTTTVVLPDVAPLTGLDLEPIATGLDHPVAIAPAPGIHETFIVERTGRLVTASSRGLDAALDITPKVGWEISEQGFLGFAVHPQFPDDPRGFAVYTNLDEDVVVSSFTWLGDRFDPASEQHILTVPQPHIWHQGGGMLFDDRGYLWMSFGDGGGIGDRFHNGQDASTLNGTLVRIDIDGDAPYVVPPSNPFTDGKDGAPEVWAYGLRNPWRFAVDADRVVIADVGLDKLDEIDVVSVDDAGANFGWPVMEGDQCYEDPACDSRPFVAPQLVLARNEICAVIGGPVYRGIAIPELYGQFVFGDHCLAWVRSVTLDGTALGTVTDWTPLLPAIDGRITTFGTDVAGELVVATLEGDVWRVVPVRGQAPSN